MNEINNFAYDLIERINNLVNIVKQLHAENEKLKETISKLESQINIEE